MVALIALAATPLIVTAVAFAKDTFPSGTYSATVTPQNSGVTPFPMSLKVVGKKNATTKKITGLTIGPIQMVCLANSTSASESVTIPALTGFPTLKSNGFLQATFVYENGGWQHVGFDTVQAADPQIEFQMVENGHGKHASIVPNASDGSAMDMVLKADVTGSTATISADGTSTCNIDDSNPTLKLKH
jgi:hypothetical protein